MDGATAVFGGGSWGTALAWLLGTKGYAVTLWCRDAAQARRIAEAGRNPRYLPEVELPPTVRVTADLEAAASARLRVAAVPTGALRDLLTRLQETTAPAADLLLACKGLELGTGQRPTEIALDVGGATWRDRLAVLSGPNLAGEVVRRVPSTTVIASWNRDLGRRLQELFGTPFFRAYTNPDVTGVELGGALKNPIAIAVGINDGLGFGANSKAALMTRGLAEMTRLGVACGASASTFAGLSGLGDLVATCGSPLSRNYRLGLALGRGDTLDGALQQLGQVAEGVPTTEAACLLADRLGVELPITTELRRVLVEGQSPRDAVVALMARNFRDEAAGDA